MYAVVDNLNEYRSLQLLAFKIIFTRFTLPNKPKIDIPVIRIVKSEQESRIVGYYDFTISVGVDIQGIQRYDDLDTFAVNFLNRTFDAPGIIEKAKNYSKALVKRVSTGLHDCPQEVQEERISICNSCPFLTDKRECSVCGCPVDIKTKWASESCPASPSKWSEYSNSKKCGCGG